MNKNGLKVVKTDNKKDQKTKQKTCTENKLQMSAW